MLINVDFVFSHYVIIIMTIARKSSSLVLRQTSWYALKPFFFPHNSQAWVGRGRVEGQRQVWWLPHFHHSSDCIRTSIKTCLMHLDREMTADLWPSPQRNGGYLRRPPDMKMSMVLIWACIDTTRLLDPPCARRSCQASSHEPRRLDLEVPWKSARPPAFFWEKKKWKDKELKGKKKQTGIDWVIEPSRQCRQLSSSPVFFCTAEFERLGRHTTGNFEESTILWTVNNIT